MTRSFEYIDCDIPEGQTLAEWRREREAERGRKSRPKRRVRRLARLRLAWRRA